MLEENSNGGAYDGYEDPEVDDFDSVRIIYGDDSCKISKTAVECQIKSKNLINFN